MERILSKDEISDLLSAVQHGEVEVEPTPAPERGERQVGQCDLFRAQGPEGWRLANLDLILDSFARNYTISLANRLQRSVNVKIDGFESMTFETLLQKLTGRGAIGILQLDPLRGGGMVIFDEDLSYSLVEIVLGGSSESQVVVPERAMTAIELNVIRDVLADTCPDLEKGFLQMQEIRASLVKVESNLRLLNFVSLDAGVMVARFKVGIDSLEGEVSLVVPHSALEPLQESQQEKPLPMSAVRTTQWQHKVCEELEHMEVDLEAQLASVSLLVRDILNFQVGDIIDLGCHPDTPLEIMVEGRPKYFGIAGVQAGKKAIRITGRVPDGG